MIGAFRQVFAKEISTRGDSAYVPLMTHMAEMMTRAILACTLVSVGSASFSSAPSFNVPQVDFGELAGLDSSASTLLLHSLV